MQEALRKEMNGLKKQQQQAHTRPTSPAPLRHPAKTNRNTRETFRKETEALGKHKETKTEALKKHSEKKRKDPRNIRIGNGSTQETLRKETEACKKH